MSKDSEQAAIELERAAIGVINAFNGPAKGAARDYGALKPMMEYNVVLKRVLHPDSIEGASDATWFLDNHMLSRKAHLDNWETTLIANVTTGEVNGTGDYYDDSNKTITPILFTLGFVKNDVTGGWSLINSHATPTGPTVEAQLVAMGEAQPIPIWGLRMLSAQERESAKNFWIAKKEHVAELIKRSK
jgi:hypothetical protein